MARDTDKISKQVMRLVESFTVDELLDLRFDLEELIDQKRQAADQPGEIDNQVDGIKEQYRKCGKKSCHCQSGELHGPYLYRYFKRNGRTVSEYIGKK